MDVKKSEGENLALIQRMLIWFNTNYSVRHANIGDFRRKGEKERVQAELRLFNGQPQLIFFYGKTRYTFDILQREKPNVIKALLRICGYEGTDKIDQKTLGDYFTPNEVEMRKITLKDRGY